MQRDFDIDELSRHRSELMGFCAISILICHILLVFNGGGIIRKVLAFGNTGVQGFIFFSGVGLHRSLQIRKECTTYWIVRRLSRIIIPYLFVAVPYWYIYTVLHSGRIEVFFRGLFFISFWFEHRGFWFIAAIIPIYIFAPLYNVIYKKVKNKLILSILITVSLLLFSIQDEMAQRDLIWNIKSCSGKMAPFFIGFLAWDYMTINRRINIFKSVLICIVSFIALSVLPIIRSVSWWWLLLYPIFIFLCLSLNFFGDRLKKPLQFMGNISLESYMLNVAFVDLFNYSSQYIFPDFFHRDWKSIAAYVFIVFCGIGIAVPYRILSKNIVNKFLMLLPKRCNLNELS